jgi:hypothetical protein
MTYTTYSAAQAVTRSKQYTRWQTAYCLNFVRNMLSPTVNAPYSLPDANSAWYRAQKKVTTGTPPAGAPVYWASGRFGHIALSLGGGYCRSTDWDTNLGSYKGHVGTVLISRMTRAWGMTYRGWSRDYASLVIRGLEGITTTTSASIPAPINYPESTAYVLDDEALRLGVRSAAAKAFNQRVWSWLYWHGGTAGRSWCIQNYKQWMAEPSDVFGPATQEAMRKMYAILGWPSNVLYPGPSLLTKLGLRVD